MKHVLLGEDTLYETKVIL